MVFVKMIDMCHLQHVIIIATTTSMHVDELRFEIIIINIIIVAICTIAISAKSIVQSSTNHVQSADSVPKSICTRTSDNEYL